MIKRGRLRKHTFVVLKTSYGAPQLARVIKDSGKKIEVKTYIRKSHRWTKQSLLIPYENVKGVLWTWTWPARWPDQ
jgi:hypothetical protein